MLAERIDEQTRARWHLGENAASSWLHTHTLHAYTHYFDVIGGEFNMAAFGLLDEIFKNVEL